MSHEKTDRELGELVESLKPNLHELMICLSHSWGGLEQVAANDAIDRGRLGLDVRVLCLEGSPIHEYLAKREEVHLAPIAYRPRNYFDPRMRGELNRFCSNGVNLIHCHQTSLLGSVIPWLWRNREVSLIASRHIMSNHDKRDVFHRLLYARLDSMVVMSQALKRNVLETHPFKEAQVRVVNLGLDFDVFDPDRVDVKVQRAEWGADEDTVVIGLVGRIDPAKGQATFIRAAAGILKGRKDGEKFKFVIVGGETLGRQSGYLEELKSIVGDLGLGDNVVFAGFQENVPAIMGAFDIFVMPSRQEAFGLVAIEAMAMECPIVISRGGSSREIVGEEEYGVVMRPEDAFDLQRQLRHLLDRPELRRKMGRMAREHVKRHYDRRERWRLTLELYDWALRRRELLKSISGRR